MVKWDSRYSRRMMDSRNPLKCSVGFCTACVYVEEFTAINRFSDVVWSPNLQCIYLFTNYSRSSNTVVLS